MLILIGSELNIKISIITDKNFYYNHFKRKSNISDDFSEPTLQKIWQWNHELVNEINKQGNYIN